MSRKRLGLIGALAAVAMLGATMNSPAFAEDNAVGTAEAVAETVQAAAPAGTDLAAPGAVAGGEVVTSVGQIDTAVPLSADQNIVVEAPISDATQTASIELPGEIPVGDGVVADDGTVVYAAKDGSDDAVAVQTLADGSTRIQTVIGSPDSPHEFGYRMDGYQPYQADTGEVIFLKEDGSYVPVAAPWATDANGNAVQTSYEIRGDELFQVVTPDANTAYPVVADPSWIWYGVIWGMKLTRAETDRVKDYAVAIGMCSAFTKSLPSAAIACAVFATYITGQAALAGGDSPKSCLFFTAAPVPGVIMRIAC